MTVWRFGFLQDFEDACITPFSIGVNEILDRNQLKERKVRRGSWFHRCKLMLNWFCYSYTDTEAEWEFMAGNESWVAQWLQERGAGDNRHSSTHAFHALLSPSPFISESFHPEVPPS